MKPRFQVLLVLSFIALQIVCGAHDSLQTTDELKVKVEYISNKQLSLQVTCDAGLSCGVRICDSPTIYSLSLVNNKNHKSVVAMKSNNLFDNSIQPISRSTVNTDNFTANFLIDGREIQKMSQSTSICVEISTIPAFLLPNAHFTQDSNITTEIHEISTPTSAQQSFVSRFLQTTTTMEALEIVKKAHSIALLVIWGFVVDISIICVRFFKAYKKYLRFHASVFAITNIASLIVIFIQIAQRSSEINSIYEQSSKERAHYAMGIIIVVIIIIQHFLGMITKLNFENENGSQKVHTLKKAHKILGYFIYVVAKANVIIGADLFEKTYFPKDNYDDYWWAKGLAGLYAIQVVIFVSIEFMYRSEPDFLTKAKPHAPQYIHVEKQAAYNSIIDRINDHIPTFEINQEFPDILYIIHENSVFDISDIQHPGGQFILKHIKGKEISRYFNGGYACEQTTMEPYRHTLYAVNFLKDFYIGELKSEYYDIFITPQQSSQLENRSALGQSTSQINLNFPKQAIEPLHSAHQGNLLKNVWSLDEVRPVNETYKVFIFTNPNWNLRTYLPGVRWFGRNIVITPQLDTLKIHSRNYSVVLSYFEENYRYRIDLIRYFQYRMREDLGLSSVSMYKVPVNPPVHSLVSTKMPFLIKKVNVEGGNNGLSKFLHLDVHRLYYLSHPIGRGLEIDETSDGEHVIFAAGTGILPFLDLFEYLLKKLIYLVMKDRFGIQEASLVNPYNEDYENTFKDNFRVRVFCAFQSKAECYGYQIMSDLFSFCNEFDVPWFNITVRFANSETDAYLPSTKQYFDSQFIDIALAQSSPSKILICGPPEFNKNIYNLLVAVKQYDAAKVQIV